jgi:uncharacterized protein YbjT (DUF2867 family)
LARCLIIGCGCRGGALARELVSRGHAVRGTTRAPSRVPEIEAAGAEAWVADPDRVGTLVPALAQVAVVCSLLGSATGSAEELGALHGTRLEMLLERILDTPVRGFLYEASGSVEPAVLAAGAERVRSSCERSRIPFVLLETDSWPEATADEIDRLLAG